MTDPARKTWTIAVLAIAWLLLQRGEAGPSAPVDTDWQSVSFPERAILILDESETRSWQLAHLLAMPKVREALTAYTAGLWRHWDDDTALDHADPRLAELFRLGVAKSPCLVRADGGRATVLPLPTDSQQFIEQLREWGAR